MPIPIEAYTVGGVVRGVLARAGHLREVLEASELLEVERATFAPLASLDAPRPEGTLTLEQDELLLVVETEEPAVPVHALWHAVGVAAGPWLVEGDMPTMPGFDPGRALARPTGTYVLLRDPAIREVHAPDVVVARPPAVLVHRYAVERVEADLMLGFFFPGARLEVDPMRAGASSSAPDGAHAGTAAGTSAGA